MLVASTSVSGFNCTTPAASPWRMPPSQPSASARSRVLACDPHDSQRPESTSTTCQLAQRPRLHDPANDDAIAEHVEAVLIPLPGRARSRRRA
jgi:hypothetical protein